MSVVTIPQHADFDTPGIAAFARESNLIEGIDRDPTRDEIAAHERLLRQFAVSATELGDFQAVVAPGKSLREKPGMNVRVGNYVAPDGGPNIVRRLQKICRDASSGAPIWKTHVQFEMLHPYMDGNGRTGRALWMWMMHSTGRNPFALPFLHRFYYQTLDSGGIASRTQTMKSRFWCGRQRSCRVASPILHTRPDRTVTSSL